MYVATYVDVIVQRLHESNVVRAGQLVGSTPDYLSGSGLTNRTVSSGLANILLHPQGKPFEGMS